jgi:hypothetical protein
MFVPVVNRFDELHSVYQFWKLWATTILSLRNWHESFDLPYFLFFVECRLSSVAPELSCFTDNPKEKVQRQQNILINICQ